MVWGSEWGEENKREILGLGREDGGIKDESVPRTLNSALFYCTLALGHNTYTQWIVDTRILIRKMSKMQHCILTCARVGWDIK